MICVNCHYQGKPKKIVKGSILTEIILWCFFIVPGLIYSLWRSTSAARVKVCPSCGSENMIPLDSPRAKQILAGN